MSKIKLFPLEAGPVKSQALIAFTIFGGEHGDEMHIKAHGDGNAKIISDEFLVAFAGAVKDTGEFEIGSKK